MQTANIVFLGTLGAIYYFVLRWGFTQLPGEKWQILAALPKHKEADGQWLGTNLTAYGLVTACAYAASIALTFILLGALSLPLFDTIVAAAAILAAVIPASSLVARIVEKKAYTFTVGGASFVGVVLAPWVLAAINALSPTGESTLPIVPTLAAFAIAYAFGEGTGRLACISFGCCYGKPLRSCRPWVQRLFRTKHFVFVGHTKKIAYAGKLHGEKVVPIQAVTCVLYVGAGLLGTLLFLTGHYAVALLLTMAVTQVWRIVSETLRADYRGGKEVSVYQVLALLSLLYAVGIVWLAPTQALTPPDIMLGFAALWQPGVIVFLQVLWLITFIYSGRSMVTGARMSLYVCEDRI